MFQHSFCRRLSQPASCSTRHARFESEIVVTKQKIRSPVEKTQGVPAKELQIQRKRLWNFRTSSPVNNGSEVHSRIEVDLTVPHHE